MSNHTPSAAVAVNRRLDVREVATIRAALRAWVANDGHRSAADELLEIGRRELGPGALVLSDRAIERLLGELGDDDAGVVVTVTRFDPHDGRRI